MTERNGKLLNILLAVVTAVCISLLTFAATEFSSHADSSEVKAQAENLEEQKNTCTERNDAVKESLADIDTKISNIDTSLRILVEGYRGAKR